MLGNSVAGLRIQWGLDLKFVGPENRLGFMEEINEIWRKGLRDNPPIAIQSSDQF